MENQHQHLLQEFKVEINNLVPTVPDEIKKQAQEKLSELKQQKDIDHSDIHPAMLEIGKKEYLYRKAYNELKQELDVPSTTEIALEKMDDSLKEKIKRVLQEDKKEYETEDDKDKWMHLKRRESNELSLHNLARDPEFEQEFDSEENRKIEKSMISAEQEREEIVTNKIRGNKDQYEKLIEKWNKIQEQIHSNIEQLREIKQKTNKWKDEIEDEIDKFQEGWSIVEQDPQLEKTEKRIDYWQEKINEEKNEK